MLRETDRRVPEDVALVGFDDSPIARHMDPPLTSVRQPTEEMGRVMVRVLLEEIAERAPELRHPVLDTELVVRASSCAMRRGGTPPGAGRSGEAVPRTALGVALVLEPCSKGG
jgi:DNA-binding LacI/PurR family transcriptional regulator